jgi:hypothetical protein
MTLDTISDTDVVLQRATESADGGWKLTSSTPDF